MKFCEHCNAKMVEYKHSFNAGLAAGLFKLYKAGGGPINITKISLTGYQWTNFQKMRYWGLVQKATRDDGTHIDGEWMITPQGINFIASGTAIHKTVWTYRGEPVRFEGNTCFFKDLHEPEYDKRDDYIENAIPHV